MSCAVPSPCTTVHGHDPRRGMPLFAPAANASGDNAARDGAFIALQNAYRPHGGISRLASLTIEGGVRYAAQAGHVDERLAAGELFGFPWYDSVWIPMFQFAVPGRTVDDGPQRVVAEWGRATDGWALAAWFVQPNAWLGNDCPIECLALRLPDVLLAARADRFVATG